MKILTINVTPRHIKKGVHCHACECPIALAVKDAGLKLPNVDGNQIFYQAPDGKILKCLTPKKASTFIKRFDTYKKVQPFSFILTLHENS